MSYDGSHLPNIVVPGERHLSLLAEGHYISNETLQSKHFVSVLR